MRKLVIVESPNKIKSLRNILGKEYIVMASVGHFREIANEGIYNMGIDPDKGFKAKYVISKEKKDVIQKLKEQVELADIIYLATDPDREGEAIAWHLKEVLKIPNNKYQRVTFNEITKKAVLKAFDTPRKLDDDLVDASLSRAKLDKMVGFMVSPVARKGIGARSVGRVQSAGLKIIVDREKEILNFVPEVYFDLNLLFEKNKQPFKAKYVGTKAKPVKRLSSIDEVEKVVKDCKVTNIYTVTNVEKKERINNPSPPFTTSTFQQETSKRLNIGVKQAMSYAQKLFEGVEIEGQPTALITYHRTDSTNFSPDFVAELEGYVKDTFGQEYSSPVRKYKSNENAQEGHEALRVTDLNLTPEVVGKYIYDDGLLKVYNIIYRRTVATAMASAIYSETIYEISNNKHLFSLSSKELVFNGYKALYSVFEDPDDIISTETFKVAETLSKCVLEALEKQTNPPTRYGEASFIKEMEKQGIGRPSTFASTIETILSDSRGYCKIEGKHMVPTPKGITLTEFLDKHFSNVINIDYTSEMEKDLDLIASGKLEHLKFLTNFYAILNDNIKNAGGELGVATQTDKQCPECGKPLVVRTGRYGQFLGCSGYPKCRHIEKLTK